MIIVGSRSGGFDFYAKKQNEKKLIWLGPTESSDLDIYLWPNEKMPNSLFLIERSNAQFFYTFAGRHIWMGCEFPYNSDGNLNIPEDKTYLSWAIVKRFELTLHERRQLAGSPFDIYDKNGCFVSSIKLKLILKYR